ncbi:hypothetical protein EON65_21070 [archaeon]|nr:MAG: hypothetical protein EON65_21070 [archaeon]
MQDAINRLMRDRTVIIIAHRLSTVKDADTIAVFGKGKIVDQGTHEELLATSKIYTNLVRKQLTGVSAIHEDANRSSLLQEEEVEVE